MSENSSAGAVAGGNGWALPIYASVDLFAAADAIVAGEEGKHGNQAGDRGGDTVYGIARNFHPDEPWPPTWERAREIRRLEYWERQHCGELPWGWALAVYDAAINQPGSLKALQQLLGLAQDGVIGAISAARIRRASADEFRRFIVERAFRYTQQSLFPVDGHGWLGRVLDIHHAALLPPKAIG